MWKAMMFAAIAAAICVIPISCLDEITLPAPEGVEQALVIQGFIRKDDTSLVSITVTRLFDFTASTARPVNVKLAEVIDDEGNVLNLPEAALGLYQTQVVEGDPDFRVEIGKSYQLHVEARDGREYFTNFEPLLEVPKIESARVEVFEETVIDDEGNSSVKEKLRLLVNTSTSIPGQTEPSRLKWDVRRVYKVTDTPILPTDSSKVCYITDEIINSEIPVLDGTERTTGLVTDFQIYDSNISSIYGEGTYLNLFQQGISTGAYQYWNEVSLLTNRTGNMFEPPAGQISTNLYNPNDPDDLVFGYFYCYAQDTMRVFISPAEVGSPAPQCPPPGGLLTEDGRCAVTVCCDCLDAPLSTTTKPEYWTE